MNGNYTGLIAVRGGSQRIKNKNIRDFCGTSLLEIKTKQAMTCPLIDSVVVSSDCDEMIDLARKLGAKTHKRDSFFCSNDVPMNLVYEHLANSIDCKNVVYLHVTSPLLKDETLINCIETYSKKKDEGYDSLATVETVKKYLWYENEAINYNPSKHPRSQDLPEYYALNFAVNIISRENMVKNKNILGRNFYPFIIDETESIDVDNIFDFEIAKFYYEKVNGLFKR